MHTIEQIPQLRCKQRKIGNSISSTPSWQWQEH